MSGDDREREVAVGLLERLLSQIEDGDKELVRLNEAGMVDEAKRLAPLHHARVSNAMRLIDYLRGSE